MILAPHFPYTVHDEPTEDWTVEQLIHWYLLRCQAKTQETRDELLESLQRHFDEGKTEILSLCDKAIDKQNREENIEGESMTNDAIETKNMNKQDSNTTKSISMPLQSIDPNTNNKSGEGSGKDDAVDMVKVVKSTATSTVKSVKVTIIAGPYEGRTFILRPKPRHPCFVGRSAGKKFRERGISLPDDSEVSTTHGKFQMKTRKIYFTDMGSTNGTLHEGIELEANVPLEVQDGMSLLIGGQTELKLSLGYT